MIIPGQQLIAQQNVKTHGMTCAPNEAIINHDVTATTRYPIDCFQKMRKGINAITAWWYQMICAISRGNSIVVDNTSIGEIL